MTTNSSILPGGIHLTLTEGSEVVKEGTLSLSSPQDGIAHLVWTMGAVSAQVGQFSISDSGGRLTGNFVGTNPDLVITGPGGTIV